MRKARRSGKTGRIFTAHLPGVRRAPTIRPANQVPADQQRCRAIMKTPPTGFHRAGTLRALAIGATALMLSEAALVAARIEGVVLDLNGHTLQQAMVTLTKDAGQQGPAAVTVFTDAKGQFRFPEGTSRGGVTAKMLGY